MRFAAFTLLIATMVAEYVALPLHPPPIPLDQCQGFSFFLKKKRKFTSVVNYFSRSAIPCPHHHHPHHHLTVLPLKKRKPSLTYQNHYRSYADLHNVAVCVTGRKLSTFGGTPFSPSMTYYENYEVLVPATECACGYYFNRKTGTKQWDRCPDCTFVSPSSLLSSPTNNNNLAFSQERALAMSIHLGEKNWDADGLLSLGRQ